MSLAIHTEAPPLNADQYGVVRIAGTRIPLERVVRAFLEGQTAEQIAQDYDTLSIATVYAVIAYYLQHRAEVDQYLAAAEADEDKVRAEIEAKFDPTGIRARLMARRSASSDR